MQYLVCEISGRQYFIEPGKIVEVDKIEADKQLTVDKVLLWVNGDKIELGAPYLEKKVDFEVLGNVKKEKIRVATYKAKANHHRVVGSRAEKTQLRWTENEKSVKKS